MTDKEREIYALKQRYDLEKQDYEEVIMQLRTENKVYKQWFINLTEQILAEIDKDGWCKLVISPEHVEKIREELSLIKR